MQVGIVGCGRMGRERARAAAAVGVEAIMLFDPDGGRAESLAVECKRTQCLGDSDELFNQRPDAIFLCTPPYCRGPVEKRAIELGIPFFAEKPIGVSAHQVQAVLESLSQAEVMNAVGYMNRYRNSIRHVREILEPREIIGIAAHWIGKKYTVPWWSVLAESGGPFNEQATHMTDLLRYLSGELQLLHVSARTHDGIETTVWATFRLAEGGLATILYSCEAKEKDILISIETPEGTLELRGWDLELVRNTIDGTFPEAESRPIFEKETDAFLRAVTTGDKSFILSDFAESYKTQLTMDSVTRIMRMTDVADEFRLLGQSK